MADTLHAADLTSTILIVHVLLTIIKDYYVIVNMCRNEMYKYSQNLY